MCGPAVVDLFCKVLLCEETVSLLGIQQYYKLVATEDDQSTPAVETSPPVKAAAATCQGSGSTSDDATPAPADAVSAAQDTAALGNQQGAAASPAAPREKHGAAQSAQQLMLLKVEALLQLLSMVSFHQVCGSSHWLLSVNG